MASSSRAVGTGSVSTAPPLTCISIQPFGPTARQWIGPTDDRASMLIDERSGTTAYRATEAPYRAPTLRPVSRYQGQRIARVHRPSPHLVGQHATEQLPGRQVVLPQPHPATAGTAQRSQATATSVDEWHAHIGLEPEVVDDAAVVVTADGGVPRHLHAGRHLECTRVVGDEDLLLAELPVDARDVHRLEAGEVGHARQEGTGHLRDVA